MKNFGFLNKTGLNFQDDILFYKNIIKDSFVKYAFDNTFCTFKSINDIIYLIYSKKNSSIITYNLISQQIINEIKNAHTKYISSLRHCLDRINKIDLIMSISAEDNNIKIWNAFNLSCLLSIINANNTGLILSSCFLNYNDEIYIITSNRNWENNNIEFIKVYDLKGNKIKEINNSNNNTFFIDNYYDKNLSKNYIITGNEGFSASFDYEENKLYKKYCGYGKLFNRSIIIYDKEEIIKLIESNDEGIIIIWNFHTGEFLNNIKISDSYLCGICLWNKDYLFIGNYNTEIIILDLSNEKLINNLNYHRNSVITIKKLIHPKYGKCLLSQSLSNGQIFLLAFKNANIYK